MIFLYLYRYKSISILYKCARLIIAHINRNYLYIDDDTKYRHTCFKIDSNNKLIYADRNKHEADYELNGIKIFTIIQNNKISRFTRKFSEIVIDDAFYGSSLSFLERTKSRKGSTAFITHKIEINGSRLNTSGFLTTYRDFTIVDITFYDEENIYFNTSQVKVLANYNFPTLTYPSGYRLNGQREEIERQTNKVVSIRQKEILKKLGLNDKETLTNKMFYTEQTSTQVVKELKRGNQYIYFVDPNFKYHKKSSNCRGVIFIEQYANRGDIVYNSYSMPIHYKNYSFDNNVAVINPYYTYPMIEKIIKNMKNRGFKKEILLQIQYINLLEELKDANIFKGVKTIVFEAYIRELNTMSEICKFKLQFKYQLITIFISLFGAVAALLSVSSLLKH